MTHYEVWYTSACPSCGQVEQRPVYDIGSGPEVSCVECEWCWGRDGQELLPVGRFEKVPWMRSRKQRKT